MGVNTGLALGEVVMGVPTLQQTAQPANKIGNPNPATTTTSMLLLLPAA